MKQNRLKEIVKELRAASKMHAGQATEISAHVKDMAKGASRSSFGPAQTIASDVVGFAGNLLKGGAGIAASMLSTTSAQGGQLNNRQLRENNPKATNWSFDQPDDYKTELLDKPKTEKKGAGRSSFGPAQWMIESAEEKAAADIKRGYSYAKMLPMSNEEEEKFYNNPSNLETLTPLLSNKTMAGYQENYQKEKDKKDKMISDGVKAKEKENDVASSQKVINQNQKNIKAPTLKEYAMLTAENVDKNKYVGPPKKKKNTCWKGYVAKGKKKSPSGKKNSDGSVKMVNNCVKISKKRR